MRLFGITKIGIIPRSMWRAQFARLAWKLAEIILTVVMPFALCLWLHHVIHPHMVDLVQYLEAVSQRAMN